MSSWVILLADVYTTGWREEFHGTYSVVKLLFGIVLGAGHCYMHCQPNMLCTDIFTRLSEMLIRLAFSLASLTLYRKC